jgi:alkylation response protein AidB-like acyl-CoA dehydrogenase
VLSTVLVMEGLGCGCHDNGLIFSLNAHMWSLEMPLVKFGSPAQRQAYPPGLVSGDLIGVHAMTEPDSRSDAFNMRTRVQRRGDSYVPNGTKLYISNAPVADVVLVFALHPGWTSTAGDSRRSSALPALASARSTVPGSRGTAPDGRQEQRTVEVS